MAEEDVRLLCEEWDRISKGESPTTKSIRAALEKPRSKPVRRNGDPIPNVHHSHKMNEACPKTCAGNWAMNNVGPMIHKYLDAMEARDMNLLYQQWNNNCTSKLVEVEHELNEVMRHTKYGIFGEHVETRRHVEHALKLLVEMKDETA